MGRESLLSGLARSVAAGSLGLWMAACGSEAVADPAVVRCLVPNVSAATCSEHLRPISDLMRASIVAKCREVDGHIVAACPTERLVGTCERPNDVTLAWTMNEVTRTHYYLHPDSGDAARLQAIAERCPTWTSPPAPEP